MRTSEISIYGRFSVVLIGACIAAAPACGDASDPGTGSGGSGATGGTGSGSGGNGGTASGGSGGSTGGTGGATGGTSGTAGKGGTGGTAGTGATGGASGSGGSAGSAGKAGSAGSGGAAGTGGSAGAAGKAGSSGASGAGGTAGKGGADGGAGTGGSAGASDAGKDTGTTDSGSPPGDGGARFSFFMTSLASMRQLSGNQNGFGGDLRFGGKTNGLDGADEICRQVAEIGVPGNGKEWRAFLSVTVGPSGGAVNAIDRVGNGPWYDRLGRVFAMTKADLLSQRPVGADPAIANDFPNEFGVPNHNPDGTIIDNHNVLTGSNTSGNLNSTNKSDTCQDWTSSASNGGAPRCGVSWPRSSLVHWISVLNEGGCAPGVTPPGADSGPSGTVGALGGYGGFYCFALTP
jgi:hypothetical protein